MKLNTLALAAACAVLLPAHVHAQVDTTQMSRSITRRNPGSPRNGPTVGISLGFVGFGQAGQLADYPTVVGLLKGGPGERAGLVVGDTLRTVNGRDARQPPVFPNRAPGARYVLRIRRRGEDREIVMVIPNTSSAPVPNQR